MRANGGGWHAPACLPVCLSHSGRQYARQTGQKIRRAPAGENMARQLGEGARVRGRAPADRNKTHANRVFFTLNLPAVKAVRQAFYFEPACSDGSQTGFELFALSLPALTAVRQAFYFFYP